MQSQQKEVEIREEKNLSLTEYKEISIEFEVREILEPVQINNGIGGIALQKKKVEKTWRKDYDDGEEPERWSQTWDLSQWGILSAYLGEQRVGGCVIAFDTPNVDMLEGNSTISVLWDIRIDTEYRGMGIGKKLFDSAMKWSKKRDCKLMKIETQNNNVSACEFYHKQGCTLKTISLNIYPDYPEEIQLIWVKTLD